ncbi:MAG: hypothetical protein JO107_16385 [Hyphomicrobiales bacterium]|nr:hypothetical protein [Hyphomicrobiales bacterium]MBV8664668.1 hypothetical protein [Hyphomicrobiales bacterium]
MTSYFSTGLAAAVLLACGGAAFAAQPEAIHVSGAHGAAHSSAGKIAGHGVGGEPIVLNGDGLKDANSANATAAIFSLAAASLLEASQR